jgi:tetratricopeptide (TPR) repeat protein
VWVADQERPVRRRVALKIIKLGMDTKEVIARFEQERQALAMMDHANIAKVLDAGATQFGRPFCVMELVRGVKITDYCDDQQLSTRDRIELFITVCQAVQHAHQKGIIHRDLKPSNILVTNNDEKAVPKVIDFGVAKATQGRFTDQTVYTQFRQMIGTPLYMSPEQAELTSLDIDTRSDIYALGVLLYELLTGHTPIEQNTLARLGMDEIRRIIREVDPPRPSMLVQTLAAAEMTTAAKRRKIEPAKLSGILRGDIDWIVMKCLEKDRTRRYDTANGLAMDLQRHLANEVVVARPPTTTYLLSKLIRRNKVAFAAGTAIAASLVIGIAASVWQAVRATRAEGRATAEAQRAAMAEKQANGEASRAITAEKLAFDRLTEVAAERDAKERARKDAEEISQFLGEVFQSPDPSRDGREIKVVELLDRAAEKLNTDLSSQSGQQARLQAALGSTYYSLSLHREAIPLQEKVRDYTLATFGPEHPSTLAAMSNLSVSYAGAGRLEEALKMQEGMLPLCRKVLGPEHAMTLAGIGHLASSYSAVGRKEEALELQNELLALNRKVNGALHPATLTAMNDLAKYDSMADRRDEALRLLEEVLAIRRKVSGPEHAETLKAMGNLATAYSDAGRQDEALKIRDEVLALSRKFLGANAPDTLSALKSLAASYSASAAVPEALKMKEEVLALCRKVFGPKDPQTADAAAGLGYAYDAAGVAEKAIEAWSEATRIAPKMAEVQYYLSRILCFQGRYADAVEPLRAACALYPDRERGWEMRERLVRALSSIGRTEEALALLAEVSAMKPASASTAIEVAALQAWFGKNAEHEAISRRMLEWARDSTQLEDYDRVSKLASLRPLAEASQRGAALALAEKAVALGQKHEFLAYFYLALGMSEYRCGHYSEAEQALLAAERGASSQGNAGRAHIEGIAGFYRAMSLYRQQHPAEARTCFTATMAQMRPFPPDKQNPLADGATHDDLIMWMACTEAKALLAEPAVAGQ